MEAARTAREEILSLIDEDFQWVLVDNPEYASQIGQHQYDHLLQNLSPEAFQQRLQHNQEMIQKIQILQARHSNCDSNDALLLQLFSKNLSDEMEAIENGCHVYPLNSIGYGGVHQNFIESLDWLGEENRSQNFLSRFQKFPIQSQQWKDLLKEGIRIQKVASLPMLRKVPQQFEKILQDLEENKGPISGLLTSLPTEFQSDAEVAKNEFINAINDLKQFIVNEYLPHARTQCGASGLPNGNEIYNLCLRYHTTTSLTAEEIHSIGLNEVARIESRYANEVMKPLGHDSTFESFVEKYKDPESGQYYSRQEDLLDGYRILTSHIETKLPKYFENFPASRMEIVPLEAPNAPAAYYMQGTSDGKRPGKFYVNVTNLTQRPIYEMTALALHEGIPGHHFQGSLALENPSIPSFLRFIEDRRYEFCPARRQLYAAYLEGWALYCESLGEEMGMYATPLNLFGRLSMEMMRAVRLVVDTGIHFKGWSVEDAIVYMMSKTGMHRHEVEAECYRYEAWPGQACEFLFPIHSLCSFTPLLLPALRYSRCLQNW
jgi:uncharacterized protein (DUF885 family)